MPVTDMRHALIDEGNIVNIVETLPPGSYSDEWVAVLDGLRAKGPWKVENFSGVFVTISNEEHSTEIARDYLERDCADAQKVRHANFDLIADAYPLIIEPAIAPSTTLGRYVCIAMTMGAWNREVPRDHRTVSYRLLDGSLREVFEAMSTEFWDGVIPFDLFDLDAGRKIELNYGNPTLRLSPDQGASFDVLDTEDYDGEIDADVRRRVLELPEMTSYSAGDHVLYTSPLSSRQVAGKIIRMNDNGEGAVVDPVSGRFISEHIHTHIDNLSKPESPELWDRLVAAHVKGFA